MDWPRLICAVVLLAIGGVMIAFNAMVFWLTEIREENAPAVAPIFGGLFAAAGIALLPMPGSWKWAWVPLAVDWGGLPFLLVAWFRSRSEWKARRPTRR